jgi:uncharacterized membrane protein YfcA
VLTLLVVGLVTGLVSGLFGLGGGFIVVPCLTFFGIPTATAVVTSVNQMTAGSLASFLTYARVKRVDYKMSALLLFGGVIGISIGYVLLKLLIASGKEETVVAVCFIVLILIVLILSSRDIVRMIKRKEQKLEKTARLDQLPLKTSFVAHTAELSAIPFIVLGLVGGMLILFLGIGGGIFMIPVLLYLLHVKETYISGTIQLQMFFTSIISTILYAMQSVPIDILLSAVLIFGTVTGARFGAKLGSRLNADKYRLFLAILLITVSLLMAKNLLMAPQETYQIYELLR